MIIMPLFPRAFLMLNHQKVDHLVNKMSENLTNNATWGIFYTTPAIWSNINQTSAETVQ